MESRSRGVLGRPIKSAFRKAAPVERPPHPALRADLSPQAGRGKLRRARSRLGCIAEAEQQQSGHSPRGGNTMKRLMILNGPNLNLLGVREPHIYGTTTLAQIKENCERHAGQLGLALSFHQSNHEGELVDWIQSARQSADAIIINPAGYSFTSVAILDALKAFEGPILEVHISNIHARDEHHRHSKLSHAATGVICGLGPHGYIAAMHAVVEMAKK
jgi:3-dehydroquinate dehydratase-2